MKRFDDDYRSDPRRRPDTREDRHGRARVDARDRREIVDDRMDIREARVDPRDRMDTAMDPRIPSARMDPRANAAARLEPRRDTYGADPRARGEPELYKDPRGQLRDARTGELYQEVARPQRGYDDPMDRDRMERDDVPPARGDRRNREVVGLAPARDYDEHDDYPRGNKYNDYFVPGTGIDREVIQHEICRYLGNDATVRPFTNKDGRQGYVVRAYRALTSAMIEDLKRDSARWRQEQERRSRSGRSTGSYAEMKGREEPTYVDPVDVDMDDFDRPGPGRRHDVDPRASAGRHGVPPVSTTGYSTEPGYYVSSTQGPGNYGPETLPRTHQEERYRATGGNTPPTTRAPPTGYSQTSYPPRTAATAPPVPVSSYRDPRTGQLISGYEPSYPAETQRRHR